MKKILIFSFSLLTISSFAQNRPSNGFGKVEVLIEKPDYYGISSSQKSKIIALKKQASRDYQSISKDYNLSGYEKGRRKRQISINLDNAIYDILTGAQRSKWSKIDDYYEDRIDDYKDRMEDRIDDRLDRLEDQYERDIERIERNYSYDKNLMKRKKDARKAQYKRDKERLKNYKNRF